MIKLTTAAQMRDMDRETAEKFAVPGIVLMENSALRVVDVLAERFGPLRGKRVAIVCGKGNNGGDGLAVARHLSARFGAKVTVWLTAPAAAFTGDAAANYAMAAAYRLDLRPWAGTLGETDLVIDALLGTGIKGGVSGELAGVIEAVNGAGKPVVAVDVPSGLDADTGEVDGACVSAVLTVTFALPKFGLLVYPGAGSVGEMVTADIGMPLPVMAAEGVQVVATEASDVAGWVPARVNGRDSNKGKFGHVSVFAGSAGFVGAPVLSTEAAARTGAGLVTLAVPKGVQAAAMARISPIAMTRGLAETGRGTFSPEALEKALDIAHKGTAAAIGPGLGGADDADTRQFVCEFVSRCAVPLVVDADALNCLALEDDHGAGIVRKRTAATILTPHPGEMGRLQGTDTRTVQADRRKAVEDAARAYGCAVLLKGARTLIADPDGRLAVNTTSNPGMATGGSGDVLTGVLAALLALGSPEETLTAWQAAACGAYLHGLAGDLAAEAQGGPAGLIATDIIMYLPAALARCHAEAGRS